MIGALLILSAGACVILLILRKRRRRRTRIAPSAEFLSGAPVPRPRFGGTGLGAGGSTASLGNALGGAEAGMAERAPADDGAPARHPTLLRPGARADAGGSRVDEPPPFESRGYAGPVNIDDKLDSPEWGPEPTSREAMERDHGYGGYGVGVGP